MPGFDRIKKIKNKYFRVKLPNIFVDKLEVKVKQYNESATEKITVEDYIQHLVIKDVDNSLIS